MCRLLVMGYSELARFAAVENHDLKSFHYPMVGELGQIFGLHQVAQYQENDL